MDISLVFVVVKIRNSRLQIFFRIGVPKNDSIFREKQLCWSFFLIKFQAPNFEEQLFSQDTFGECFCKIFVKLVNNALLDHLDKYVIFSYCKYGSRFSGETKLQILSEMFLT